MSTASLSRGAYRCATYDWSDTQQAWVLTGLCKTYAEGRANRAARHRAGMLCGVLMLAGSPPPDRAPPGAYLHLELSARTADGRGPVVLVGSGG